MAAAADIRGRVLIFVMPGSREDFIPRNDVDFDLHPWHEGLIIDPRPSQSRARFGSPETASISPGWIVGMISTGSWQRACRRRIGAGGDFSQAEALYRRSLNIGEQLGDQAAIATSYHQLLFVLSEQVRRARLLGSLLGRDRPSRVACR